MADTKTKKRLNKSGAKVAVTKPGKKALVKVSPKSASEGAKRTPPKKVALNKKDAKPSKVPAQRSGEKKTKRTREPWGDFNEHGFRIGSDSAAIVDIMIAGAFDRNEINALSEDAVGGETRNGNPKNVPSLVSGLLSRLQEQGYTVESSWRLVPPSKNGSGGGTKGSKGKAVSGASRGRDTGKTSKGRSR